MDTKSRISFLKVKIEMFQDQLAAFEVFVESFDTEAANLFELQHRATSLSYKYTNLEESIVELSTLDKNAFSSGQKKDIDNRYFSIFGVSQKLITDMQQRADSTQLEATLNQSNIFNDSISNVKFPAKSIPTFSGNYEEFVSFKNRFTSMIESKKNLTNLDKFDYLCSALKGDSKNKLSTIATDSAYDESWNNLERAYGSKRILTSHHLNKLLNLPKIEKGNYKSLIELTDKALQHVEALKSLKMILPSEAVVVILENKLDSPTLDLWDKETRNDELPKLEKLTDFLYHLAARLSRRDREKPSITSKPNKHHPAKIQRLDDESRKTYAMVTQGKTQMSCVLCPNQQHPLYICKVFNAMTVEKRNQIAKKHHLCFNCLKKHNLSECKSYITCKTCNKKHHSLLHGFWIRDSGAEKNTENDNGND